MDKAIAGAAYVEKGGVTFVAVHEEGALKVAQNAARHGVEALAHISGIGADPESLHTCPWTRRVDR